MFHVTCWLKRLHHDAQHTCDPIVGFGFHARFEVDENKLLQCSVCSGRHVDSALARC